MFYQIDGEIHKGDSIKTFKKLPKGNLLVMQNDVTKKFYLKKLEDFVLPEKVYGDLEKSADRYLNTFKNSKKNLGVLLSGLKGDGKSLTAEICSVKSNLPTLWITQPFLGEEFLSYLSSIKQECIILMNEFEKTYKEEDQEQLLSVLDGSYNTKFLFILTCNRLSINENLKNRPTRLLYHKKFDGLEKSTQQEIIDDCLENKEYEAELKNILQMLGSVSTDVIMKFIDEINMYDESPKAVIKHLNIEVEHSTFDVLMFIGGKRYLSSINYNPLTSKYIWLSYKEQSKNGKDFYTRWYECATEEMDIQVINGEFVFRDTQSNKFTFTPSKKFKFEL